MIQDDQFFTFMDGLLLDISGSLIYSVLRFHLTWFALPESRISSNSRIAAWQVHFDGIPQACEPVDSSRP